MAEALTSLDVGEEGLEIVFVDDGSSDATWSKVEELAAENEVVSGIRLSRNFGHQGALLAGLSIARGGAVITMDGDLQHPPELIPSMIAEWKNGAEIVTTTRNDDATLPWFKRATSSLFYFLFSYLANVTLRPGQADFRLLDRKVVNELVACPEKALFLRGLVAWLGFRTVDIPYSPSQRYSGTTAYSLRRMILFAFDAVFSFSLVPLRLSVGVGSIMMAMSFCYGLYVIAVWLSFSPDKSYTLAPGWASIIVFILFLFSILFIQIGLVGEYVGRIYIESKNRPRFVISERS